VPLKSIGWHVALYLGLLAFPLLAHLAVPYTPARLLPPIWVSALWVGPVGLLAFMRNPLDRLVAFVWLGWFVVGSLNIVASYYIWGSYWDVEAGPADLVYVAFTFVFFAGLLAAEALRRRLPGSPPQPAQRHSTGSLHPAFEWLMLLFPLFYAVSMYRTLGYLPLLQGVDLTKDIYELDYGRLYGYSIVLVLSALVAVHKARHARMPIGRLGYAILVPTFLFVSILDGKRFNLMLFMAAILVYFLSVSRRRTSTLGGWATVLGIGLAGVVLYVGVLILRQGFNLDAYAGVALQLQAVGVEHRDFVYSLNHYTPGHIPNYHWAGSAAASALNSKLLEAFGVDKLAHVFQGSAYVWKDLFGIEYGIRTGIISELYFAYGWFGLPVILGVGIVVGMLATALSKNISPTRLVFGSTAYAMLLLTIVGQTTGITGGLTVLLYAYVVLLMARTFFPLPALGRLGAESEA